MRALHRFWTSLKTEDLPPALHRAGRLRVAEVLLVAARAHPRVLPAEVVAPLVRQAGLPREVVPARLLEVAALLVHPAVAVLVVALQALRLVAAREVRRVAVPDLLPVAPAVAALLALRQVVAAVPRRVVVPPGHPQVGAARVEERTTQVCPTAAKQMEV